MNTRALFVGLAIGALGCSSGAGPSGPGGSGGAGNSGGFGAFGAFGGGAGLGGSGGSVTPPSCDPGRVLCGTECVNLAEDPRHCSACDAACGVGEVCSGSTCTLIADCTSTPCPGLSYCDLATKQCKPGCAFTEQCGNNEVCDTTQHACTCAPGFHRCGGVCVPETSTAACGASCTICPTDANGTASCNAGTCALSCNPGFHACGNTCKDSSSVNSCGSSCSPCPTDPNGISTCNGGSCGLNCNTGYHLCGSTCASDTSPNSCGSSCTPCPTKTGATAACTAGQCTYTCTNGVTFDKALKIKSGVTGLGVGDVTGDGKLDIVTSGGNSVMVHPGNGDGTFKAAVAYALSNAAGLALGDINGDNRLDVVVGSGVSNSTLPTRALWKLLGQANGTLSTASIIEKTTFPAGTIVLADFSGDSKLDYAYLHGSGSSVYYAVGNGNGTFGTRQTRSINVHAIAAADSTGDGRLDLIAAGYDKLYTLPGTGTTSMLGSEVSQTIAYQSKRHLGVGDLNGDKKADAVIGSSSDGMDVHLATSGGNFGPNTSYTGSKLIPVVADFNDDGKLDVTHVDYSYVHLRLGNGSGSLGAAEKIYTGNSPVRATSADMNGDGFADLVYTRSATWNKEVVIQLSKCK